MRIIIILVCLIVCGCDRSGIDAITESRIQSLHRLVTKLEDQNKDDCVYIQQLQQAVGDLQQRIKKLEAKNELQ